jgi:hypothetical protein
LSRKTGVLTEILDGEAVVLDVETQKAYHLNRPATILWQQCDGSRNIDELAAILKRELDLNVDVVPLAELGVQKLESLGLMQGASGITRRSAARKLGLAAALIPVISAMTIPAPARAGSFRLPPPPPPPPPPPLPPIG